MSCVEELYRECISKMLSNKQNNWQKEKSLMKKMTVQQVKEKSGGDQSVPAPHPQERITLQRLAALTLLFGSVSPLLSTFILATACSCFQPHTHKKGLINTLHSTSLAPNSRKCEQTVSSEKKRQRLELVSIVEHLLQQPKRQIFASGVFRPKQLHLQP